MKKFNKISITTILVMSFVFGFSGPTTVIAATSPSLGAANNFSLLSSTFTRNVGVTTIVGNLGYITLGGSGSHTISGTTFASTSPTYTQAGIDQGNALTDLNNQVCTFTFANGAIDLATDITHGPIGVYTPGVYCTGPSSAASIGTGGITLSGAGTYIFRIDGALTTVDNSNVTLANNASSCDVFWTPTAATTLGANTTFKGVVIDASGITVGNTTSWIGRALAFGGTVTFDTDSITSTCTEAPPTPATTNSTGTSGAFAPLPLINVTKIPSPLALPGGPASVTYTYTVTNIGVVPMIGVWVKDNKCSPVNFIAGDSNNNSELDLTETWIYRCSKMVSATETNTATAHGWANGWDGHDTADATVIVSPLIVATSTPVVGQVLGVLTANIPSFPDSGFSPQQKTIPWNIIIPTGVLTFLFAFYLA